MKILCFGASHVAAIKAGFDIISSKEKLPIIDFFGISSRFLNEVQTVGDCLQLSEHAAANYRFTGKTNSDNLISLTPYDTIIFVHESNLLCPQYLYKKNHLFNASYPLPYLHL